MNSKVFFNFSSLVAVEIEIKHVISEAKLFLFSLDIKSICSVYFFHASFESLENWFQSACSNLFDPVRHSIHISKNLPGVHFLDIGLIYKRENVHFSIYKSKIMHFSNEFFE